MTPKDWQEERFVPLTRAICIGDGVVYRPVRSWHSGVFAGERKSIDRGDRSGCIFEIDRPGFTYRQQVCSPPYAYTHRVYWHPDVPGRTVSAFLSYPNGMGACPTYFWEAMLDDVERFDSEEGMEAKIREHLRPERPKDGGRDA